MTGDLARSLVDAAAEAIGSVVDVELPVEQPWSALHWQPESRAAVAAVLETLAAHYYDRAEQRAQADGDGDRPQCDGDCGNDDCHMTSAVAAWQMAAATAQRVVAEVRAQEDR